MIRFLAALSLLPAVATADVPRVMTDIAPIHSLTAQVMGDLGTPDLLLPPGADPHDFALRPSDAARLGQADLVIWVGEGLTPWLAEPLQTLAPQAASLSLLEVDGWEALDAHEEEETEEHDDDHDHDHDHGDIDPHGWLDPVVAQVWVAEIARNLSTADSENAATYAANAQAAIVALNALEQDMVTQLAGLSDRAYVLPHDGYRYFETRVGLTAQAAIAGLDARTPGPAQIAQLREQMTAQNVVCVFSDAEIGDRWANLITEGTAAKTVAIDGVGLGLGAGPMLYDQLIRRLATQFTACLEPDS